MMKIPMRFVIIASVAIVMAGFVAVGVMQTREQAAQPMPPAYDPVEMANDPLYSPTNPYDGRDNQEPTDISEQPVMVAVDVEYEKDVTPVAAESVPQQIVGVPLKQVISGQEAIDSIGVLHGVDISITDGIVAQYSEGEHKVDLWFSSSDTVEDATALLTLMLEKMKDNEVYSTPVPMPIRKRIYYQTIGNDAVNFFFQRGRQLVWVTLDVSQDQMMPAMKEVVGI